MHWWPRLPRRLAAARLRRHERGRASRFLVAAVQAEGLRESALTSVVLVGPATLTATASASASLYYYVLTAVCLLLGFAGLAFGETLSRWLAPRSLLSSVAVAWLVTVVRFLLEKSAAPALLVQAIGVTLARPRRRRLPRDRPARRAAGRRRAPPARSSPTRSSSAASWRSSASSPRASASARHYDVSGLTSVPVALTGDTFAFVPGSWRAGLLADPRAPARGWPSHGPGRAALVRLRPADARRGELGLAGRAQRVRRASCRAGPQRWLPSRTRATSRLQSSSLEHVALVAAARSCQGQRRSRAAERVGSRLRADADRGRARKAFGLTGLEAAC